MPNTKLSGSNESQDQLLIDAISKLSSQIATLSEQLAAGNTRNLGYQTLTRGSLDTNSQLIWICNLVAITAWLIGAGICAYGLRTWPLRDVSRFLMWGLSAASFGLSASLFWRWVDCAWIYVLMTAMPAYVGMNTALSSLEGDLEEEKLVKV